MTVWGSWNISEQWPVQLYQDLISTSPTKTPEDSHSTLPMFLLPRSMLVSSRPCSGSFPRVSETTSWWPELLPTPVTSSTLSGILGNCPDSLHMLWRRYLQEYWAVAVAVRSRWLVFGKFWPHSISKLFSKQLSFLVRLKTMYGEWNTPEKIISLQRSCIEM